MQAVSRVRRVAGRVRIALRPGVLGRLRARIPWRIVTRRAKVSSLTRYFEERHGYAPNLDEPRTLSEKLLWYKLFYRDPLMWQCADKVRMRDYVAQVLGPGHTAELFGVWGPKDEIPFDDLPEQFVLKFNASSGTNIICTDKSELDIAAARARARAWVAPESAFYLRSYEWVYKGIPPQVLAEELLDPTGGGIRDYKVMCFNGLAKFGFINSHVGGKLYADYFSAAGEPLPVQRRNPRSAQPPSIPQEWATIVSLAERLAEPFPHVRVDFYVTGDRILVGELTFITGDAVEPISPPEWDTILGDMWELDQRPARLPRFEVLRRHVFAP